MESSASVTKKLPCSVGGGDSDTDLVLLQVFTFDLTRDRNELPLEARLLLVK